MKQTIRNTVQSERIEGPLCARNGRLQYLHALIFRDEFSLHSHADALKSSGAFFGVMDREKALRPQKRAEGPCGGADKHCYVKRECPGCCA